ncbi:unnamed protein product [Schistosoma margrebowiei]|uniref:Uncharacterized protein n=1 Tax=Schistosoma margrebowiei TaxID=48269 RepID=A0A183M7N6_9TREM|nr:unnamed protein product [Schistosoma margrebowiei]
MVLILRFHKCTQTEHKHKFYKIQQKTYGISIRLS